MGLFDDEFVVWNLEDDTTASESNNNEFVFSVACSPTSSMFAIGGGENTLDRMVLMDIEDNTTLAEIHEFISTDGNIQFGLTFSKDGNYLYGVGKNKVISKYDVQTFDEERTTTPANSSLSKIRVSDDGKTLGVVTNI